jgi:hypothetical protein
MRMPGFNAEASLGTTTGTYWGNAVFGGSASGDVSPAQFRGFLSRFLVTTRCCQYSPLAGKYVCTSHTHFPWQHCRCVRTMTFPVILCDDPVITTDV